MIYISNNGVQINLFNQNLSIASFYFCTNTISAMFLDVLTPFNEEKDNLLKNLKPTSEEIASQREVEAEIACAYNELRLIEKLNIIDDREKAMLISQVANRIMEKSSIPENAETHNN